VLLLTARPSGDFLDFHEILLIPINVLTELEMTSDARQNGGKACYVKHWKCVKLMILKRFSLLTGPNDAVHYGVT